MNFTILENMNQGAEKTLIVFIYMQMFLVRETIKWGKQS